VEIDRDKIDKKLKAPSIIIKMIWEVNKHLEADIQKMFMVSILILKIFL